MWSVLDRRVYSRRGLSVHGSGITAQGSRQLTFCTADMIALVFAPLIAAIPAINATVLNNDPTL